MKGVKIALVIFGAIVITALGIDAADTLQGNDGTLLSQLGGGVDSACPQGMVSVQNVPGLTCVDAYEAAPGDKCPVNAPSQILHTRQNIDDNSCKVISSAGKMPWRFVSRDQAVQLCARANKRLPTSAEWFALSAGMANVESSCNVSSNRLAEAGTYPECVSSSGVFDLVGNAWEWVSDDVIDGVYNARKLPSSGYVAQVDAHGIATVSTSSPSDMFESDYFWSEFDGAYGIIRGGYYDSGSDGGLYTVHADVVPTSSGPGIGFRCVF